MSTLNQLIKRTKGKNKHRTKNNQALEGNPQKRGTIIRLVTRTPKKPNSAIRKLALIRLVNRKRIYAFIPGGLSHNLQEHSVVLIRGGRVKDLPGIRYRLIRGTQDFAGLEGRKNARSKFGTKRVK